MKLHTIGFDLGKTVLRLVGLKAGNVQPLSEYTQLPGARIRFRAVVFKSIILTGNVRKRQGQESRQAQAL